VVLSCVEELLLQGGQRGEVKNFLRQLTKLAHKFDMIWVLILKYTEKPTTLHDGVSEAGGCGDFGSANGISKGTTRLGGVSLDMSTVYAYASFYQALSQFPTAGCLVQTRVVAQPEALPAQLYCICQEAANTATLKHNMLLSTFLHRPFLRPSAKNIDDGVVDEDVLQAHCT
jgi:hypothetical protein